jgi:hypothetical protein
MASQEGEAIAHVSRGMAPIYEGPALIRTARMRVGLSFRRPTRPNSLDIAVTCQPKARFTPGFPPFRQYSVRMLRPLVTCASEAKTRLLAAAIL